MKKQVVIIVGVNRGGTSAVAASFAALGIPLGKRWHEPIYEDLPLARAFRERQWRRFGRIVSEYEACFGVFAWKLPDVVKYLGKVHRMFTNPRYIFVFRDICAVSTRVSVSIGREQVEGMLNAHRKYQRILAFIRRYKPDCVMMSYEKMLTDIDGYASSLLAFLDMEKSSENVDAIKRSITTSPSAYRTWAENSLRARELERFGYMGHVDHLGSSGVMGWAKARKSEAPIAVDIYADYVKLGTVSADLLRKDLIEAQVSRGGRHGFRFMFDEPLAAGVKLSVRPAGCAVDLIGSPRTTK